MSIASNFNFLSDIKDIIDVGEIYKNDNIHILSFSKIEDVINFGNYLYDKSTIFLERKKQIFEKIKK